MAHRLCIGHWLWFPLMLTLMVSADSDDGPSVHDDNGGSWWQRTVFYQIYPRSFMDSNGDGVGDLRGIRDRLAHLKDAGIGATWLSPIFLSPMVDFGYDITDYTVIQPEYGTMQDFEELMAEARRLDIKIILDFVPNHTSDQCEWFRRSVAREPGYSDYYVWHDGREDPSGANGTRLPPNNWQSVFYGSAWTYHPERGQYYLHQFTAQQPDLNFRNPAVVEEMKQVLRFWLRKGVAGFRIDAINHLFEVEDFRDEPETGTDRDPLSYGFTHHIYTKDLLEDYDMVYQWRELLDEWSREHPEDEARIIMTEAYANITFTMRYYHSVAAEGNGPPRAGSHMPFNFLLITDLNRDASAPDFVFTINKWLTYMPRDATANWVLGNHDQPRVGSRFGTERIDAMHTLVLTLPGIAVTYYGEEIGMVDYRDAIATGPSQREDDGGEAFIVFSRDPERTPFQWDDTTNAGFSVAPSTWLPVNPNYRELNLEAQKRAERSHYKTYQELVRLRQHDTFRRGSILPVPYSNDVLTYVRELQGSDTFVVVINLAASPRTVDLSAIFPRLAEQLTIASSGSTSSYRIGDIVRTNQLLVDGNDGLVLRSIHVPERQRVGGSARRATTNVLWSAAKDAAVIASIIIAVGTSYYHFRFCPPATTLFIRGGSNDGDGNGDLRGLLERFDHLVDLGVTGICLGPLFLSPMRDDGHDVSDYRSIDPRYGTLDQFKELLEKAHGHGIKVVLDLVPNHTSDEHEWFQKMLEENPTYREYYITREGVVGSDEQREPPNNWRSLYHRAAWSQLASDGPYYLHQFDESEPELNYRNAKVKHEMEGIIRFWLDTGADGLRFEKVDHLLEDRLYRNEPLLDPEGPVTYENMQHNYTRDLNENYVIVFEWRTVFDEYTAASAATGNDASKLMITAAYGSSLANSLKWFAIGSRNGAHIAQNFAFAERLRDDWRAEELQTLVDGWLNEMPPTGKANWALGSQNHRRVASRFGRERAAGLAMLSLTLPGTVFVYYGEEIGMEDNEHIGWTESVDPLGCNTNESSYLQYSRDPARTPFQWDASNEWAGFADTPLGTPKADAPGPWLPVHPNYRECNLALAKASNRSLYHLYRGLIRLRQESSVFARGAYRSFVLPNNVFAILRSQGTDKVYGTVMNANPHTVTLDLTQVYGHTRGALVAFVSPEGNHEPGELILDVTHVTLAQYETIVVELKSGAPECTNGFSSTMRLTVSLLVVIALGVLGVASGKTAPSRQSHDHGSQDWWEAGVFYQIYPRSFKDSDSNGVGDLKGITEKLGHLVDLGIDGVWLSPVFKSPMADFGYDIADFRSIDPLFGTMADLDAMIAKAKELGIRVILDFVPNHTSDEHEWFVKAQNNDPAFRDFYVWREPRGNAEPNNWQSVFHTPAWTRLPGQTQYYLHQFDKKQPDLNYQNQRVKDEMESMIRFWLDKGVDGFRIDAINHVYEDPQFRDEELIDPKGELIWENLDHKYTQNLPECYDLIYDWRDVFDQYKARDNVTRLMMTEAYANLEQTMLWYGNPTRNRKGAHIPFNFAMINRLSNDSRAGDFKEIIDEWLDAMPAGQQANWVLGNHDRPRIASRFGRDRASSFAVLEMTLPGIAVVYYGEEIGMEDNRDITFEETKDPQAANTNPDVYQQFTRDPVRTPFQWDDTAYAGFTSATARDTWLPVHPNYRQLNLAAQKAAPESMFKLYQRLIKLRKEDTFRHGDYESKVMLNNVFGYTRTLEDHQSYAVVVNLNDNDVNVNLQELHADVEGAKVVLTSLGAKLKEGDEITEVFHVIVGAYDAVVFEISSSASTLGVSMLLMLFASILRSLF
ncbi:uncharacterized protein LOC125952287 [Anopheles darlingi]|uniref:uncharacterized protein LOC125952287 n=1 Tax=Anopheles darlingi TaxID=43151 RepID=UPI00210051D0|nr:uncharacterized protein LOC125952287 [Anopheles darlingi]